MKTPARGSGPTDLDMGMAAVNFLIFIIGMALLVNYDWRIAVAYGCIRWSDKGTEILKRKGQTTP